MLKWILTEIGGIDNFVTPNQLIAFFRVDPAANLKMIELKCS
ncbi:IS110 family transposase [Clostridium estertheticum]|nr:IS110 family transposase [Clostridium estertheticum]